MCQVYPILEAGHCKPWRVLQCVWLSTLVPSFRIGGRCLEYSEEALTLMSLGWPWTTGMVPGLLCYLPQSHHWEKVRACLALAQALPLTLQRGPGGRWCPRLKPPDETFLDPGDSWASLSQVMTEWKLGELPRSDVGNLHASVSCHCPGAPSGLASMWGCLSDREGGDVWPCRWFTLFFFLWM